jgi:hypothetical protein
VTEATIVYPQPGRDCVQLLLALQRLLVAMGTDAAAANSFVVPV